MNGLVSDTFHFPCHDCGQAVEVAGGARQPHECAVYDNDMERLCAAYWAGYNQAAGVNDGQGGPFPSDGADDPPDESKGAAFAAPAPVADALAALADEWSRTGDAHLAGAPDAPTEYIAGLQTAAGNILRLCADQLRAALTPEEPTQ